MLAAHVLGHPASSHSTPKSIQKRTVNLNAYKLGVGASYTNNIVISEQPAFRTFTKPTYVDTATTLVRSKFPDAEFRLVSNYVSGNGVGHVVFKQTVHGIDIDTADLNVNVSISAEFHCFADLARLAKTAPYFRTVARFTPDQFLQKVL